MDEISVQNTVVVDGWLVIYAIKNTHTIMTEWA